METKRLTKEEADELWKEYCSIRSRELRDKLILNYLHLVKFVVGRVASNLPPHVKIDDMYSTGIMGLIKAIEKYDPTKKNKFETYAILLIKGAIIDEMRALDWVPRSVHQKANMVSSAQTELAQKLGRDPTDKEVASHLKLSNSEYDSLLERVRPAVLIPLDATQSVDDSEEMSMAERIPDDKARTSFQTADYNEFRKLLEKAVLEMPEQERTVLVLYYYENLMLKEIGEVMGVSESRVSQIHTKAVLRLRGRLREFVKEFADIT